MIRMKLLKSQSLNLSMSIMWLLLLHRQIHHPQFLQKLPYPRQAGLAIVPIQVETFE